jgi:hypothetical protein
VDGISADIEEIKGELSAIEASATSAAATAPTPSTASAAATS